MKEWKTPEVKTLSVGKTAHHVKWCNGKGWYKWSGAKWDFCGHDYKPTCDDILVGEES